MTKGCGGGGSGMRGRTARSRSSAEVMRLPSSLRMEDLLHGVVLVEVRGEGGADEAHRHAAVGRKEVCK